MKSIFQTLVFFFLCASAFGAAKTETRLLISSETARPGDTVWVGIQLKMPSGWHTYWRNAGDSGIPSRVDWVLPAGVKVGELQWPLPEKLTSKAGDVTLITYVYNDTVILTAPMQLSTNLENKPLTIKAKVSWQECQEMCISGRSELQANLMIGAERVPGTEATLIDLWRKKVPLLQANPPAHIFWTAEPTSEDTRPLLIEWEVKVDSAEFFPYVANGYEVQAATEFSKDNVRVSLEKTVKKNSGNWPAVIGGVLVGRTGDNLTAIEVNLPFVGQARSSALKSSQFSDGAGEKTGNNADPGSGTTPREMAGAFTLSQMFAFAFLGGLILNIMPCVLPVIFLKVLSFVSHARQVPGRLRNMGMVYGLGILVSFAILAGLSILVHQAGGIADWGSAFRNPQFRIVITILILLVALNLFGVFEVTLGGKAMGAADQLASRQGYVGAFFNGVLATVLATPCTAPFLGVSIAFAFTQPPVITLGIFLAAGLGLALPFVLVCWKPWLLVFFPKPGAWMEQFKVAIGFAVLATAVWLFWFTATRLGKDAVLWFGLFLVLVAFTAWLWGQFVQRAGKRTPAVTAMLLIVVGAGYGYILEAKLDWRHYSTVAKETIDWQPWSLEAVEKARRQGHPVLVDFTADSCLNCQVNKRTSLEIPATRAKLKAINAVAFLADYTDENPAIARELVRFQRAGVPMVLVYSSRMDTPPMVLPPILTPAIVLHSLEKASKMSRN